MDLIKRNRIVFWILIFLTLINIAALATYFISLRKPAGEQFQAQGGGRGMALRKELSLSKNQTTEVNKVNYAYQASSEPIAAAIREKKAALLEELAKDNSDSLRLALLVDEVSLEHKKLQQANVRQFLDLKKICTPEQTQKLSQLYAELYGCERQGRGRGNGQGQGQGQGQGHRHRYGQQQQDTIRP